VDNDGFVKYTAVSYGRVRTSIQDSQSIGRMAIVMLTGNDLAYMDNKVEE